MSIPPCGYSIPEFREIHHYGASTHKALKAAGLAPRETVLPGSMYARITPDDYAAWLKLISSPDCQIAEVLRRHALCVANGRKSARSPGHPSQIWKRFRDLGLAEDKPRAAPKARPRKQAAG
jgi:hypothetical protein